MKFIVMAKARWKEGYEDPIGHRPDICKEKSRSLRKEYEADSLSQARADAEQILREFEHNLPKAEDSYGDWSSKPEIVSTTLAKIIPF